MSDGEEASEPGSEAERLHAEALQWWAAAADDPGALDRYYANVEALAQLSGGPQVAVHQLSLLRCRLFPVDGSTDPEGLRDHALLSSAIENCKFTWCE